jgi:potassium-dependent mechanosensitive channel
MNHLARFFLVWLMLLVASFAVAQELEGTSVEVQSIEREMQVLADNLDAIKDDDGKLVQLNERVQAIADKVVALGVTLSPRLTEIRTRIDQLGPVDETVTEPAVVQDERRQLTSSRALINTLLGQLENISIRANNLTNAISDARRELFTSRLSRRYDVNAAFGPELLVDVRDRYGDLSRSVGSWARFAWRFKSRQMLTATALSLIAALLFLFVARRMMGRLAARDPEVEDPGYFGRLMAGFLNTALPTFAFSVFVSLVYLLYGYFDLFRGDIGRLFLTFSGGTGIVFLVWRLAEAVFAPSLPSWRLVPVTNRAASILKWLVIAMAVVTVADGIVTQFTDVVGTSLPITVANSLVSSVLIGFILAFISFVRPFPREDGKPDGRWPAVVRTLLLVMAGGLILAAFAGYIGFAGFASGQLVITGAVAATMYLGYLAARAISREHTLAGTRGGRWLSTSMELSEARIDQLGLLAGILLTSAIFAVGVPLLLIFWGFKWADIRGWLLKYMSEFSIGSISISITGILSGIVVFFVGFWLTKVFQRWIDGDVLSRGHVDTGVRNSIKTAIGYAGITLAALVGISAAGLDLSQLALVAGALSLGIGFGLQNIVSNFVSGLILLAERPFKVGDWIEAGAITGTVKSINVRATEIETFQRKTVILPNSDLINSAVSNWTHRNTLGRIEIPVGVSYKSDPNMVRDVLLDIARDHPRILKNPEPFVVFANFGDSSLDFELRAYLADINFMLTVSTEVRFAIFERFKAAGIEIPFPQRDVNVRVMDEEDVADAAKTAGFGKLKASRQEQHED